ncbi:hypothetical protein [Paenibacillus popilliae]|nr:hypothetical protein [Paenibacillus popilliae]
MNSFYNGESRICNGLFIGMADKLIAGHGSGNAPSASGNAK